MLTENRANIVSLVVYIAVVMLGVWYLIGRANSMYGTLYGRLTDIEVKAIRIERDLSDPARLFNELANEKLNLDDIFGVVDPSQSTLPENGITQEEVAEDV
jgi:hypothetical protein